MVTKYIRKLLPIIRRERWLLYLIRRPKFQVTSLMDNRMISPIRFLWRLDKYVVSSSCRGQTPYWQLVNNTFPLVQQTQYDELYRRVNLCPANHSFLANPPNISPSSKSNNEVCCTVIGGRWFVMYILALLGTCGEVKVF